MPQCGYKTRDRCTTTRQLQGRCSALLVRATAKAKGDEEIAVKDSGRVWYTQASRESGWYDLNTVPLKKHLHINTHGRNVPIAGPFSAQMRGLVKERKASNML